MRVPQIESKEESTQSYTMATKSGAKVAFVDRKGWSLVAVWKQKHQFAYLEVFFFKPSWFLSLRGRALPSSRPRWQCCKTRPASDVYEEAIIITSSEKYVVPMS
jgi:hypothetical protein